MVITRSKLLACLAAAACTAAVPAIGGSSAKADLLVQMFPVTGNTTPSPAPILQSGYTAFDVPDNNPQTNPGTLHNFFSIFGGVTVKLAAEGTPLVYTSSGIIGNSETNSTDTGTYGDLLSSGFFARRDLVLVFSGLTAGNYTLYTDNRAGGTGINNGPIYYSITTNTNWTYASSPAILPATNQFTQYSTSGGAENGATSGYDAGSFTFTADGTHDVILTMQGENASSTNYPYNVVLNGFDLASSNILIPEPATLGLMAVGGLGILFSKRRKTA